MQRGRSAVSVRDLLRAELVRSGDELRFRGDPERRAAVTADGHIEFEGTDYTSPSTAAKAANQGISTNGWLVWRLSHEGRSATLSDLREALLRATPYPKQ